MFNYAIRRPNQWGGESNPASDTASGIGHDRHFFAPLLASLDLRLLTISVCILVHLHPLPTSHL